jgi:hypothetical protein
MTSTPKPNSTILGWCGFRAVSKLTEGGLKIDIESVDGSNGGFSGGAKRFEGFEVVSAEEAIRGGLHVACIEFFGDPPVEWV